MTPTMIRDRVVGKVWARLYHGVYGIQAENPPFEQSALAGVLAAGPGAVASFRTAGALHGFPNVPRWVEVSVPNSRHLREKNLIVHRPRALPADDCTELNGVPVTTAARTLADVARIYDRERMGQILDHSIANKLVKRAEVEARLADTPDRWRAAVAGLRAALDERPNEARPFGSEFESHLFAALRQQGVPLPRSQYRVLVEGSERFLDFAYPEEKLALEADSYIWHASWEAWERDRQRNNLLTAVGWSFLLIPWHLLRDHPEEVVRQVLSALASRAA